MLHLVQWRGTTLISASESFDEPVVTILLKNLHQYRLQFFRELERNLTQKGIVLRLVVGGGLPEDEAKGDTATLGWAQTRNFRTVQIRGKSLLWQPGFDIALNSDLVITEQATKQLFNLVLSFGQRAMQTRHCFWGHGKNFQASIEGSAGESLKEKMTKRAHWFFAYNELSAEAAVEFGMDPNRITMVMNSTDTKNIRELRSAQSPNIDQLVRAELKMGDGPVALYLGGVYGHKRPDFLIKAAEHVRTLIPDFEMLVIGDGSDGHKMAAAAEQHDWFHHLGACYGDERVALSSIASLQMMPGLVGLNIVDAFALGIPTITTNVDYHSPEIEYLQDGVNGIVTPANATPVQFAVATAEVLADEQRLEMLQRNAEMAGSDLTVEEMARRFADGVVQALL